MCCLVQVYGCLESKLCPLGLYDPSHFLSQRGRLSFTETQSHSVVQAVLKLMSISNTPVSQVLDGCAPQAMPSDTYFS